jgi:hypothetical protein
MGTEARPSPPRDRTAIVELDQRELAGANPTRGRGTSRPATGIGDGRARAFAMDTATGQPGHPCLASSALGNGA